MPVVVRDSAVSSGNIRACPSTVVAEPQRRLDHATQIPFLAQSSAVIRGVLLCPKWKLLLPKVEVRCLSAARLESANLNTLPKWKGAFAARALIAEPIKELNCGAHQSLNCGAHQRAAHYHAPCTPPSPWRSASGLARPSAGRLVGASPRGTVRRSHLGAIRGNQWQSVAISGNQKEPFRSHQRQSEAIRGNQWQSVAISSHQWQSLAIRSHQW